MRRTRPAPLSFVSSFVVSFVVAAALLVACSTDTPRSTGAFCERLRAEAPFLDAPLVTPADVTLMLERYRSLAAVVPLSIQEEWDEVTALVEAAATIDLDDEEQRRALTAQAYATEQAARDVAAWALERCEITLQVGGLGG